MVKKLSFYAFFTCLFAGLVLPVSALEKVKVGYLQAVPHNYLPLLAGQEKGFWKENDLALEIIPFGSDILTLQAFAAKGIDFALGTLDGLLPGLVRGAPIIIVGQQTRAIPFAFWVPADSFRREPKDLKGARIGIVRFGGPAHTTARIVLAALGLENEVKFVASGGLLQEVAAFRAGVTDVIVVTIQFMARLKLEGKARELLEVTDYLPKDWPGTLLAASKELVQARPLTVKKLVRAIMQASNFAKDNRAWAVKKIGEESRFGEKEAELVYEKFVSPGIRKEARIEPTALAKTIELFVQYGVVSKEKAPDVEQVYAGEFAQ